MKSRVLSGACVAAAAVLVAGCGGGSTPHTSASAVNSASSSTANSSSAKPSGATGANSTPSTSAAAASASSAASAKTSKAPDATVAVIQSAQVPAACEMPAQKLSGGKASSAYLPSHGQVITDGVSGPLLVDLAKKGSKQVLWGFDCDAGNVAWPEVLVLSDASGNLLGSVDFANVGKSEHAGVTAWHVQGNDVVLTWEEYEGAGFDKQTHQSVLTWSDGKLVLKDQAAASGATRANVPSNAAPGAGGPRPSNATPLTENDHSQYGAQLAFKSPTGLNGCQILTQGDIRCGTNGAAGGEFFMTATGQPEGAIADDAPMWPQADKLSYGQVRYAGNTVFASTDQGVTVWNTQTGHGALINTSGVHQF